MIDKAEAVKKELAALQGTWKIVAYEEDGKDVPLSGSAIADMISLSRVDARTIDRTDKKAGKVVQTLRRTVSADGKTLTVVTKGTNAQGQPINNTAVYDKQ